jgi:hypothetical protein
VCALCSADFPYKFEVKRHMRTTHKSGAPLSAPAGEAAAMSVADDGPLSTAAVDAPARAPLKRSRDASEAARRLALTRSADSALATTASSTDRLSPAASSLRSSEHAKRPRTSRAQSTAAMISHAIGLLPQNVVPSLEQPPPPSEASCLADLVLPPPTEATPCSSGAT